MPKAPPISDAEWEVMKAIWDAPPPGELTAGEVVQRLEASGTRWKPRTIKTLLARLVRKGAVRAHDDPGARGYLYRAAVTREACSRHEIRSFLSRVFDGAVAPAMLHFLEGAKLSRAEIDELRKLLDREARARGGAKERDS
jgi:BlaI family penicillinase repressor